LTLKMTHSTLSLLVALFANADNSKFAWTTRAHKPNVKCSLAMISRILPVELSSTSAK